MTTELEAQREFAQSVGDMVYYASLQVAMGNPPAQTITIKVSQASEPEGDDDEMRGSIKVDVSFDPPVSNKRENGDAAKAASDIEVNEECRDPDICGYATFSEDGVEVVECDGECQYYEVN